MNLDAIFELSLEEKLHRVDAALADRRTTLAELQRHFEESVVGLNQDIAMLEAKRAELVPPTLEVPAAE